MTADWLANHDTKLRADMLIHYTCSLCEMELHTGVVALIEQHSAVVSLFDDYDIDLQKTMPWEFRSYAPSTDVTVRAEDPLQIEVPVTIDDDEFIVLINEQMEVADIES